MDSAGSAARPTKGGKRRQRRGASSSERAIRPSPCMGKGTGAGGLLDARSEALRGARVHCHDHHARRHDNSRRRNDVVRRQVARRKRQQPNPPPVGRSQHALSSGRPDQLRGRHLDHADRPVDPICEQPHLQRRGPEHLLKGRRHSMGLGLGTVRRPRLRSSRRATRRKRADRF